MSVSSEAGFELSAGGSRLGILLREIWRSRALIQTLAKKDFFVRYRRASLGMLWAIGLPLIQAGVLIAIFSRITQFKTGVSYPVFVLWGVLPWSFFSSAVSAGAGSIVEGAGLATKTYFPRAVLPIVSLWSGFRGYVPAVGIMFGVAAAFEAPLGVDLLLIVPATLLMLALAAGFSLVLAAGHVYFRDTRFIVQAAIMPWFWASGVVYPLKALGPLSGWLELNPAVGIIQFYRASLGPTAAPGWGRPTLISVAWVVVLIAVALPLYRRYDRVFVDLL